MPHLLHILVQTGLAVAVLTATAAPADDTLKKLDPFLSQHCFECHDDDVSKGDLDLSSLAFEPGKPQNAKIWEHVFDRVAGGEMPPAKKTRPESGPKKTFLTTLKQPLLAAGQARQNQSGRVHTRRLTRLEYEHTLHDLLGIDIPLQIHLPEDPKYHGFQTVAKVQQLSHFHLKDYLNAADIALEEAFARLLKGDETYRKTYTPKMMTEWRGGNYRGPQLKGDEVYFWKLATQFGGRVPQARVPEDGWYRITLKNVRGVNRGSDDTTWGSLSVGYGYSNEPIMRMVGNIEATAKPRDISFDVWMEAEDLPRIRPNESAAKIARSSRGGNVSFRGTDFEKEGYTAIALKAMAIERIYPNAGPPQLRQRLIPGITFKEGKPILEKPVAELHRLTRDFARRAFRRPINEDEIQPYLKLAQAAFQEKEGAPPAKLAHALRSAYRAILCSPHFLTLVEAPGKLDGHAVASRLSYTFTDSLPTPQLRKLADAGELDKPWQLRQAADKLLDSPRSARFIESFTDQWLDLAQIDFTQPDPRRFGSFDPILQESLVAETRGFFSQLLKDDLPVTHIIQSDFAMLDTRLQAHYGYKGADVRPGQGLQKVSLPDTPRTGIVTQGAILKVTADGSITSPVIRGVWLAERILGIEVPPPPANVPAIEPDIRGATSIRDQLDKHRSSESCQGCHDKIDPAGFALESFDPIGRYREFYGKPGKSAKVDPSGKTPDGHPFKNFVGWKKIYLDQPDILARNFASQFLTYATGAPITFADRPHLDEIVKKSKENGYGIRSLIIESIQSPIFLHK